MALRGTRGTGPPPCPRAAPHSGTCPLQSDTVFGWNVHLAPCPVPLCPHCSWGPAEDGGALINSWWGLLPSQSICWPGAGKGGEEELEQELLLPGKVWAPRFVGKTEFHLDIHSRLAREGLQHKGHPGGGEALTVPARGAGMGWVCHLPSSFPGKTAPLENPWPAVERLDTRLEHKLVLPEASSPRVMGRIVGNVSRDLGNVGKAAGSAAGGAVDKGRP